MDIDIGSLFNNLLEVKVSIKLEDKLENLNYSLEEFLNDSDAIQCYKQMGKNTKKYFRPQIVKQLIKYITEEPENDDYLKGHKYPYIASELLKTDCSYIQDLFVLSVKEYNNKYKKSEKNEEKNENKEIKNEKNIENKSVNDINAINEIKDDMIIENNQHKEDKMKEININNDCKENNINNKNNIINNEKEKEINKIIINEENVENKNNDLNQILDVEKNQNNIKKENKEIKKEKNTNDEIISQKNNEFLDLLLDFVKSKKKKLNNILCGYFSEVLMALIKKYPYEILNYFYTIRKDALDQLIYHSYQKSISIIATKILQISDEILLKKEFSKNSVIDFENIYIKYYAPRYKLFKKILFSITLDGIKDEEGNIHEDFDVENIFDIIFDILDINFISIYIVNDIDVYNYLIQIIEKNIFIKNENNKKRRRVYILYIKFVTKIIKKINESKNNSFYFLEDSDKLQKLENKNLFYYSIYLSIEKVTQNFIDLSSIDDNSRNKLGIHNIYILDYIIQLFKYMKRAPKKMDAILILSDFLPKSFDYFFKFPLNNIYHYKFIEFFKLYLENISHHSRLTYYIFYLLEFHEILADYINQENGKEIQNIIKEKNINDNEDKEILEFIKKLNSYKKEYIFKPKKSIFSGIYPYIIQLIYIIQVKSGLKTFDENEKKLLNITNLGEFEFLKDDTSNKNIIKYEVSDSLKLVLNSSDNWKNTFNKKVLPLIRKYEGKLYNSEIKKEKENINENEGEENSEKYNDVNFWEVKITIDSKKKNKIKNKSKNDIIDEEDELLGIAMKLEEKEKKIKNNNARKNTSKKETSKKSKNVSKKPKINLKSKSQENKGEKNKENKDKKLLISKKKKKKKSGAKKPLKSKNKKSNINKEKNNEYNDVNFWKAKPESLLNESEIKNILDDL